MKPANSDNPTVFSLRSVVATDKDCSKKTYVPKNLFFALLLSVVMCSPVMANIIEKPEAIVIDGLPGSKAVLEGNYEEAIRKLDSSIVKTLNRYDRAAMKNNLCVAYLKSGMFDAAEEACISAKKMAKKSYNIGASYHTNIYQKNKSQLLMASEQNLALVDAFK